VALIRNLGQTLTNLTKPDGTEALSGVTQSVINSGVVQNITNFTLPKATDILKLGGASSILPNLKSTAGTAVKNTPKTVPNPMEQFASVNVLWTLAVLTPQQFNNPSSYRTSDFSFAGSSFTDSTTGQKQESSIIFSSGGRGDQYRTKTFYGTPEYFINNFQMNCIIGTNEKTGNSNAIKFSFDIYEPYSMGLLLQSMQNAAVKAGYLSYLDNTPYVLRMDIQGYNELGQVIKSVKPKFFTLKLTSMKFTVNEGGSTYKVEAIPYNHQGFSDAINTTYNDIKISGGPQGNVVEALSTSESSLVAVLNRNEEKLVKEGKIGVPDRYSIQFPKTSNQWFSSAGNPTKINRASLKPGELNQRSVAGSQVNYADDKDLPINEIGAASFGFDNKSGGNALFKRAGDQIDQKTGLVKRDGMTIDPKSRAFQFGQGQSLTAIINQIILSSDYAKKAITEKPTPEGYIKWFKLDVQVELLKYDPIVGDYAKKITYRVVPYFIHQSIFANPSSAPVGYAELMKQIAKEYQYIYTGQNVDVLKFDININNLFYSGVNPSPENEGAKTANQDQKGSEKLNSTTQTGKGQAPAAQAAQLGRSRPKRDPKLLKSMKGGSGDKTTEQAVAENFQNAFISGNSADMVTVNLEILGDPYWLVDSGLSNYFADVSSPVSQITNDGTMNYESGNVYIYLTFRTPADINEKTGLYDFSIAGKESPFGGIYRVNMCENVYSDGIWKQTLKCLRMPGPQGPEANKTTQGDSPSVISKEGNGATVIDNKEPPKTSPIQDTNKETNIQSANASPSTTQNTSSPRNTKTVTTSNAVQPVTGFRYYRDLGQN
jgi:hypothetical protein